MPLGIHRHIITVGGNWDPSDSVTTSFHIDAADTSSYSLSGSNVSSITDKAGNFSITVNGTPTRVSSALNSLNVWDFSGSSEDFTTSDEQNVTDGSGNHWAIGVFLADTINDNQDSFYSFENNTVSAGSKRDYAVSAGNASAFNGDLDLDGLIQVLRPENKELFVQKISEMLDHGALHYDDFGKIRTSR